MNQIDTQNAHQSAPQSPPRADPDGLNPAHADHQGQPGADGVEAGAVFLARNRQQRRVWAVRDGRVHFFVRPPGGGAFWSPGHPPHLAPTIDLFLAEVARRLSVGRLGRNAEGAATPCKTRGPDRPVPSHRNEYR